MRNLARKARCRHRSAGSLRRSLLPHTLSADLLTRDEIYQIWEMFRQTQDKWKSVTNDYSGNLQHRGINARPCRCSTHPTDTWNR